jgi:hypothetical protein
MTYFHWQLPLIVLFFIASTTLAAEPTKLRLIVETDAGGDPDDEQSLVRFFLYACDFEVEGVLCTRPKTKTDENKNSAKTGLEIVRRHVKAYEAVYDKLKQHGDFPPPQQLYERTVAGYDDSDDGVKLIIAAVDRDDPRPVWFSNWGTNDGTKSSLERALDRVLAERGEEGYAKFKRKLRLCSDDLFGEHTKRDPAWPLWVYTKFPDMDGGRWYHRFGPLTAKAGGFDLKRDVLTGHGPLGELYPTNTHLVQKEGDTPEFLYLIPNGLNEPDQPTWGSWAGRFGKQPKAEGKPYYWPDVRDTIDGQAHRDHTLTRWAAHLQNDFRARMDWCVRDYDDANHPPVVKIGSVRERTARPGERITLDASGSSDPDQDELDFHWIHYPEPGGQRTPLMLEKSNTAAVSLVAPPVEAEQSFHLIVAATDRGEPPLTRYRRVIVRVRP